MKEKTMRIMAATMFIVAAVVMALAANLSSQPRWAPKTKQARPCPPFCEQAKPTLYASPAARPWLPCPPFCKQQIAKEHKEVKPLPGRPVPPQQMIALIQSDHKVAWRKNAKEE
jgi:hypothetical protein